MKIVINGCFGGFGLSHAAMLRYAEIKGFKDGRKFYEHNIERDDPALVQVVEELGVAANGDFARLKVEELPAGTRYIINDYDGNESIQTPEDTDWSVSR